MEPSDEMLLQEFNRRQVEANTAVITYAAVVIFLGIVGNAVAIAFYGFNVKPTVTTYFLTALSVNDLLTSIISTGSFVNFTHTVTFRSVAGCMAILFPRHVFAANSNALLLLIAVDRYLRIRWTFSKVQMSKRSAKMAVAGFLIFNILMAVRCFFLLDSVKIEIRLEEYNRTITGHFCKYSEDPAKAKASMIFNNMDIAYTSLIIVALVVLYTAIGKWVASSNKKRLMNKQDSKNIDMSEKVDSSYVSETCSADNSNKTSDTTKPSDNGCQNNSNNNSEKQTTKTIDIQTDEPEKPKIRKGVSFLKKSIMDRNSVIRFEHKLTLMAFVITLASILSFVPYFIITLVLGKPDAVNPGEGELGPLIQIGRRSYMLNTTINPYIMGVFNRDFRRFVVGLFQKLSCRQKKSINK